MTLQVSKIIILPRVDKIKDPEAKKVIQDLLKVIQKMNTTYYNDLVHVEERVTALE